MKINNANFNIPIKYNSSLKQNNNASYPNLSPLKCDTVSFGCKINKPLDLIEMPVERIIKICNKAIKENNVIGEGQEAIAIKVPDYPYCIRIEKKNGFGTQIKNIDTNLNKFDKVNHVVANLGSGIKLLEYVSGIPLKIMHHSDTPAGIKVKESLQELVAKNFTEKPFKNAISQVEYAKSLGIDFDRNGENLLVDPISQDLACIDFSPNFHMEEYNPIAFLYDALGVDKTEFGPAVLGKLCKAYATRLTEVPLKKLNLDQLDHHFYARGFINDIFNNFPDRELLKETEAKIQEVIETKKNESASKFELKKKVEAFRDFVDENLINYEPKKIYEIY